MDSDSSSSSLGENPCTWACTTFEAEDPIKFLLCCANRDEHRGRSVLVEVVDEPLDLTEQEEDVYAAKALAGGAGAHYEPWAYRRRSLDEGAVARAALGPVGRFVTSRRFEGVMLVLILFNSLLLALWDPRWERDGSSPTWWTRCDQVVLAAFFVEAVLKIAALRLRYFGNAWNVLDLLVVATGVADLILSAPNVSFLKTLRILRPLRTVSRVPRLERTVTVLLRSLRSMRDILLMIAGVLLTLSLAAMSLWSPSPVTRCVSRGP